MIYNQLEIEEINKMSQHLLYILKYFYDEIYNYIQVFQKLKSILIFNKLKMRIIFEYYKKRKNIEILL